jgi:hypothetical protein
MYAPRLPKRTPQRMRNDDVFQLPTSKHVERAARRARSEAVHAYLKRAADWTRRVFSVDAVKVRVPVASPTVSRLSADGRLRKPCADTESG